MEIFYIILPCTASWVTSRKNLLENKPCCPDVLDCPRLSPSENTWIYTLLYIYLMDLHTVIYLYAVKYKITDSYTVVCLALECILRKPLSLSTALLLSPGHRNMKHVRSMWRRKDRGCSKGTSKGLTVSSATGETRCIERTPALPELEASCGSFSYIRLKQVQFKWKCPSLTQEHEQWLRTCRTLTQVFCSGGAGLH